MSAPNGTYAIASGYTAAGLGALCVAVSGGFVGGFAGIASNQLEFAGGAWFSFGQAAWSGVTGGVTGGVNGAVTGELLSGDEILIMRMFISRAVLLAASDEDVRPITTHNARQLAIREALSESGATG